MENKEQLHLPLLGKLPAHWNIVEFSSVLKEGTRNGIYKQKDFHGFGDKIVNMGELFAHPRIFSIPMKRVKLSESEESKFRLEVGDLLFARRSLVAEGAGKCSIVCEIQESTTFESSIIRARPNSKIANSFYLYYLFNSPYGTYILDTIRRQVAVSGITGTDLIKLLLPLPPLPEQKAIANILGTLDDKIELNRQMNQTLEAMAKAIFKSWFVDFDPVRAKMEGRQPEGMDATTAELFPDSFEESALGLIPKGWKIGTLETECDLIMGQSPKSEFYNTNGEGLPFHQGVTNFEKRFPIHKIFCKISHRIAQQGDILLSVRAPVGRINIADTEIIIGRGLSAIRHKKNYQSMLFYQLQDFFKEEDCIGTGTVYTAVTKQEIQTIKLLVPLNNLGAFFNAKIKLTDNIILNNVIQSRTLTSLRDSLLPKLMSGEIRVKEAERAINDVVQL